MIHLTTILPLLAARDTRLDGLTSQFRERRVPMDTSTVAWLLALVAGIIVVFWLFARIVERPQRRANCHRPWQLLWSLARAHRLRWSEILFLWRLARHQELQDPARLFLEPERLTPQQAGPALAARPELLESLRSRLFAGLEAPGEGPPDALQPPERCGPEDRAEIESPAIPFPLPPSWTNSGDTPSPAGT